ncbi:MAG TPA: hypothetical protein VKU92_07930 [Acidimicrobiales bacterium]|nr:hypothetical protein [Acidimicrobiales bacterium]
MAVDDAVTEEVDEERWRGFVTLVEARLREALVALYGPNRGREATVEALNWSFTHRAEVAAADGAAVRKLFLRAQERAATLVAPPAFDRRAEELAAIDPRLADVLSLLPMRDRVAVLLVDGAGWTPGAVGELLGCDKTRVTRRLERSRARLAAALAAPSRPGSDAAAEPHDGRLGAELTKLFDREAVPVSAEEAMVPGISRAVWSEPPQLSGRGPGPRSWRLVTLSAIALLLLVGGIVLGLRATRSSTATAFTTPGSEPRPGQLYHSVIVVPNPPQEANRPPRLRAVYEIDAGSLRTMHTPDIAGVAAESVPVTSGPWLAEVLYPPRDSFSNLGRAIVFRSGSAVTRSLGPASQVYPGLREGLFWLVLRNDTMSGRPSQNCSIREETVTGRTVLRNTAMPCLWQVLAAVRGGLLVLSGKGITELWNPSTGLSNPLPGFGAASVQAARGTIVSRTWARFCSVTCRVTRADPVTGVVTSEKIVPPAGLSLTSAVALSPNGRFLAIAALPIDEATTMNNEPFVGGGGNDRVVQGQLVIVRIGSGAVAMSRPVTFLEPPVIAWAADGSYVFVTRSATAVAAVPVWSVSAPVVTIRFPPGATSPPDPGERFLVVGR